MADAREYLEKLASGFMPARTLLTAVELDVFSVLGGQRLSAPEIAGRIKADGPATARLLDALAALKLLEKSGTSYGNTAASRRHLVAGAPGYLGDIMMHRNNMWSHWSRLTSTVRTGEARKRRQTRRTEGSFIKGMANIGRYSAAETVSALKGAMKGVKRLLDVGGGPAVYACAFARAFPDMAVTVFDLPGPLEYARENIAAAGLDGRVKVRAGDIQKVRSLGTGYDAVFCSNFIHCFKRPVARRIMGKMAKALREDGHLFVKEFFINEDRTGPAFAALFSLNMLVFDAGDCFTRAETEAWMDGAGLKPVRYLPVAQHSGVIMGCKKGKS